MGDLFIDLPLVHIDGHEKMVKGGAGIAIPDPVLMWTEEDGLIKFWVEPNRIYGEEWIPILEKKGIIVTDDAKEVLKSGQFYSTNTRGEIVLQRISELTTDKRTIGKIISDSTDNQFKRPSPDLSCLIAMKFSFSQFRDMEISWIITPHHAIKNCFLGLRLCDSSIYLDTESTAYDARLNASGAFAFEA